MKYNFNFIYIYQLNEYDYKKNLTNANMYKQFEKLPQNFPKSKKCELVARELRQIRLCPFEVENEMIPVHRYW